MGKRGEICKKIIIIINKQNSKYNIRIKLMRIINKRLPQLPFDPIYDKRRWVKNKIN